REPGGGGQQKLVRDLWKEGHQRQLQLCYATTVSGPGVGARWLLPTQSVSGHGLRDRLHLGVRSVALDCRKLTDGRRPMQFIPIVVTIAAAILFDVRPSGAYQGPWCAVENVGGDVRYDCSMRTLEQCVSLIIAGNRGFCNPNPYYRGPEAAPPGVKRKR